MGHLYFQDPCEQPDIHAYVVIYSVTDFSSFRKACHMVDHLKKTLTRQTAIILVANKNDMVRNRIITEAGNCNSMISDAYIYTSALIVLRTMIVRTDPLIVKCKIYLWKPTVHHNSFVLSDVVTHSPELPNSWNNILSYLTLWHTL